MAGPPKLVIPPDAVERLREQTRQLLRQHVDEIYRDLLSPRERAHRALRELGRALADMWHERGA